MDEQHSKLRPQFGLSFVFVLMALIAVSVAGWKTLVDVESGNDPGWMYWLYYSKFPIWIATAAALFLFRPMSTILFAVTFLVGAVVNGIHELFRPDYITQVILTDGVLAMACAITFALELWRRFSVVAFAFGLVGFYYTSQVVYILYHFSMLYLV